MTVSNSLKGSIDHPWGRLEILPRPAQKYWFSQGTELTLLDLWRGAETLISREAVPAPSLECSRLGRAWKGSLSSLPTQTIPYSHNSVFPHKSSAQRFQKNLKGRKSSRKDELFPILDHRWGNLPAH